MKSLYHFTTPLRYSCLDSITAHSCKPIEILSLFSIESVVGNVNIHFSLVSF